MPAFVRPKQSPKRAPFRANRISSANFTIGTENSNAITVSIQLLDEALKDLAVRGAVTVFLSDDANGDGITGTAAAGGIAGGTDGWFQTVTTGKMGLAVSEADGDIDIVITHATGAKTWYVGVVMPDGGIVMSEAVTFAA